MGSGKTSTGKKLSKLLQYQFVDTDEWIEEREGRKVSEIFQLDGEKAFRNKEHDCLLAILDLKTTVISTGGGFPCHHDHMQFMNDRGLSIYLEADTKFLASRLINQKSKWPLIANIEDDNLATFLEDLLKDRRAYYEKSHIRIASKNLKASDIINAVNLHGISF